MSFSPAWGKPEPFGALHKENLSHAFPSACTQPS